MSISSHKTLYAAWLASAARQEQRAAEQARFDEEMRVRQEDRKFQQEQATWQRLTQMGQQIEASRAADFDRRLRMADLTDQQAQRMERETLAFQVQDRQQEDRQTRFLEQLGARDKYARGLVDYKDEVARAREEDRREFGQETGLDPNTGLKRRDPMAEIQARHEARTDEQTQRAKDARRLQRLKNKGTGSNKLTPEEQEEKKVDAALEDQITNLQTYLSKRDIPRAAREAAMQELDYLLEQKNEKLREMGIDVPKIVQDEGSGGSSSDSMKARIKAKLLGGG